jgi:hypothetical protein
VAAPPARHRDRDAGRDSQHHLRHVGPVHLRAPLPAILQPLSSHGSRHPGHRRGLPRPR